jgi:steroid delta-isomerase-like uncharacterized protein
VSEDNHRTLVQRYYDELWNRWDLGLVDRLLADDLTFRGSLGVQVQGRAGFRRYVELVRRAFPDFHNTVEDLLVDGDRVAARLTYRGTHRGALFGMAASGRVVSYGGLALFRIRDGRIADGWVLGDTLGLLRQLGATTIPAG